MKTSPPSFFVLRMSSDLERPLSRLLAYLLPAFSDPRVSCVSFSPLCLSPCLGVWRGGSAVPSCGAVWLVARRSIPVSVGCLPACVFRLSIR